MMNVHVRINSRLLRKMAMNLQRIAFFQKLFQIYQEMQPSDYKYCFMFWKI